LIIVLAFGAAAINLSHFFKMKKLTLIFLILSGCASTGSSIQIPTEDISSTDAGVDAAPDTYEEKKCEPLVCRDQFYTYCDVRTDECGNTIDCGKCAEPYSCGSLDLQEYWPNKNVCGLNCNIDKKSKVCPHSFPIEYSCPFSKKLISFFVSDEWEKEYYCDINYQHTSEKDGVISFCCGL
jgi:hypothetical protein